MITNIFQQKIMMLALSKLNHNIYSWSSRVKAILEQGAPLKTMALLLFSKLINNKNVQSVQHNSACFHVTRCNVLKYFRSPSSLYLLLSTPFSASIVMRQSGVIFTHNSQPVLLAHRNKGKWPESLFTHSCPPPVCVQHRAQTKPHLETPGKWMATEWQEST